MKDSIVLYIHGQGGSAEEAAHYIPLFPNSDVIGLDYSAQTPWEAAEEFPRLFDAICAPYQSVTIIANSIGAFFTMHALPDKKIDKACFISPVVDMQKLIEDMMTWTNVSEDELREKGEIETPFGQTLSWAYLTYVRAHPIEWRVPTRILYGGKDHLTALAAISAFAEKIHAPLTVMDGGEHWFHTPEQMQFLDTWLKAAM